MSDARRPDERQSLPGVDALTGLIDRRSFVAEVERALRTAEVSGRAVGFVRLEIDRFEELVERHGASASDRVLRLCAQSFARALSPSDILARLEGPDFVAVVLDSEGDELVDAAERCREAIRARSFGELLQGEGGGVTVSVGVTSAPRDALGLDELMALADAALARAKSDGRDRVRRHP